MKRFNEKIIEGSLFLSALLTVLTTFAIVTILAIEATAFFGEVSFLEFITDKEWTPLYSDKHFGILSLLAGTFLTTVIAILVAIPIGMGIAIYLSEYASRYLRKVVKPLLELLAAVPTVVYGFFALTVVTPFLQGIIPGVSGFNALSAGIVMGIMIIPFISSLSEDALRSVPNTLREAAFGMGSTKLQTTFRITIPAASSGIMASVILAISRAIGETMIVTVAAGQMPGLSLNPLKPVQSITAYIVQVSSGDVPFGSVEHRTIFACGIALFVLTFILNSFSFWITKKYRLNYE